jgi:hypothetical protein
MEEITTAIASSELGLKTKEGDIQNFSITPEVCWILSIIVIVNLHHVACDDDTDLSCRVMISGRTDLAIKAYGSRQNPIPYGWDCLQTSIPVQEWKRFKLMDGICTGMALPLNRVATKHLLQAATFATSFGIRSSRSKRNMLIMYQPQC